MSESSIAEQIEALRVKVPTASRYQAERIDAEVERKERRSGGRRYNTLSQRRAAERAVSNLEFVFNTVVDAAVAGDRCPTSDFFTNQHRINYSTQYFAALARDGRIRIEVTARNWRTVWICEGLHRGRHTMLPPLNPRARPYFVAGPERPL
jgi:hypothetical protein